MSTNTCSLTSKLSEENHLNWKTKMKVSELVEIESGKISKGVSLSSSKGMKRGLSIMDFILRICAATSTLGSALSMGTAKQTMPFATRFVRFKVVYHDLPTFV
jgi:hypothetical protein